MSSSIRKPFDLLFKHTMGNDVAIQDFLKNHISAPIYQRIDPQSIQPTKQSYVPADLKELYSDLVCQCNIDGKEAFLYFLVEHQSQPSWRLPLRLIKYQTRLLEDYLSGKKEGTPWPIVLCACFYHGESSPYPYSTNIYDYFTDPVMAKEVGAFEKFHLIDLTIMDEASMQQHGSLALMEQILKYSRRRDFFSLVSSLLEQYKAMLEDPANPLGEDYWYAVYLVTDYALQQQGYDPEAAASLFAEKLNLSKTKEDIMTVTQAIKQEARQEGMQQGMQKGIQRRNLEIARNMLYKLHLDIKAVKEATGLSEEVLMKLQEEANG